MAVHTSWACLWDTLSSRPADLTVFAGSRSVIEYPHSGICLVFLLTVQTNCRGVPYMSYVYDTMMIKQVRGCTLSAEKNFQRRSAEFLFVFWALFPVLYGVSGSVFSVLGCASMLVSVTFYVGMREVWMLRSSVAKWQCGRRRQHSLKVAFYHVLWSVLCVLVLTVL